MIIRKRNWKEIFAMAAQRKDGIINPYNHTHIESGPKKRRQKNGVIVIVTQCEICGKMVKSLPKQDFAEIDELPEFDESVWERLHQQNQEIAEIHESAWWEIYNEYLMSDEWAEKRALALMQCKGICVGCGVKPATQVHHFSYNNVGDEFLFELAGVCDECHERIHGKS